MSTGRRRRRVPVVALVGATLAAATIIPAGADGPDRHDFGYLAIGVPAEDIGGIEAAGSVVLLSVSGRGAEAAGHMIITQASLGGRVESGDRFGSAIAYGDFDGDGHTDLAIGVPGQDLAGAVDAGQIHVVPGRSGGVDLSLSESLTVDLLGGRARSGDFLGAALAVGDFDGDGYDDLVASAPGSDAGGPARGRVHVVHGGPGPMTPGPDLRVSVIEGGSGSGDYDALGAALAVGDFDGDGFDDIAVGVPGRDAEGSPDAGTVLVFGGGEARLQPAREPLPFGAGSSSPIGPGASIGSSLAAGDFDGDGFDDLAAGAPGSFADAGAVLVAAGSPNWPSVERILTLVQGVAGPGSPEPGDRFGSAIAAGDFTADGASDLAIGAPGEDLLGRADAGLVTMVPGTARGLIPESALVLRQGVLGGSEQAGDRFGSALRLVDLDGDGAAELVVGAPGDDIGNSSDAGIVHVLHGIVRSGAGRRHLRFDTWLEGRHGVGGAAERGDRFGSSL